MWRSRIPELTEKAIAETEAIIERFGFRVEAGAKSRARVDTGFMRGEIRFERLGPYEGEVRGNAEYTIFHELGTSTMAAQPMFGPAAEEVREEFIVAIRRAWSL